MEYTLENEFLRVIMPFFVGGHPAFNCPIVAGDDYTDYYVEFEKEETCSDEGDQFEEKRNVQFAEPGESKSYSFKITVS